MKKLLFILLITILVSQFANAQAKEILTIRKYREQNTNEIIQEFTRFLAIPNVASDTANLNRNAALIVDMMRKRGIQNVQLLNATTPGVPPAVYGDVNTPGAKQTLVFYAHYDGQPVNPAQWAKGLEPFDPKLFTATIDNDGSNIPFPADNNYKPEWRIYSRSASDL